MDKKINVLIIFLCIVVLLVSGYIFLSYKKVVVSFNTQYDRALPNVEIYKGESVSLPVLERDGYEFLGWYIDNEKIDNNYKFDKTVVLNAKWEKKGSNEEPTEPGEPIIVKSNDFKFNLILQNHELAEKNQNYLISPYSIELALSMLRDGASDKTKEEIDKVIGTRKINDVTVKDKVSVANAIFIKDKYQNKVIEAYKNNLKTNYNADMIIDKFTTPDKINEWVKEKTKGMIPTILDDISPDFVLGLANALAIDVEWLWQFECNRTKSEEFTKSDGSKFNVEMMHRNGYQYIKESNVEGIVLPYKKEEGSNVELEFVGLIPAGNLDNYINNDLENDVKNLNKLIKTPVVNGVKEQIVNLSLPRFTYDSGIKNLKTLLQNMGIRNAFNSQTAKFDNMISDEQIYVETAIHKTHIDLMEKGTKAAAVTYFGMDSTGLPMQKEKEYIDITFNKPFVYMIREKNTGEILFFGTVFEPNEWKSSTCSNNGQSVKK